MHIQPYMVWIILGVVFAVLEFMIPGMIIIFFGIGAILIGILTTFMLQDNYVAQMIIFLILSILSLVLLRKYMKNTLVGDTADNHQFANDSIGEIAHVTQEINSSEGKGHIKFRGSLWKATADEVIPEGSTVKIVEQNNITYKVRLNKED